MTKKQIIKNILTLCCMVLMSSAAIPMAFAGAEADGGDSSTSTTTTEPTCKVADDGDSFNVANCLSVSGQTQSALNSDTPTIQIILNTVVFITKIIGSVAVLILVIAGLLMITSMHKEQQITRAKEMFVAALVGLILTFTAFIIATFVQSLFYT